MDTVEDLISIMRKIIDQISPTPIEVQLQCVHCVLKTLSGPGQELKIDDEYFIQQLKLILKDLPFTFHRWDVVLDCIDLCMLKKREERTPIIISFIRIMLLISIHVNEVIQKLFLCQIHNILLRYPRTRIIIIALQNNIPLIDKDDDKVEDLAMLALKTNNSNVVDDMKEETLQDGTWLFPLIKFSSNPIISNTIDTIISKNLLPLPYHINDANYDVNDQAVKRLTDCFRLIPSSITKINNNNNNVSTSSNNTSNKNVKTKKGDAISNSNHKKKHSNNDNRNNFGQQKKSPQKKKWNKK